MVKIELIRGMSYKDGHIFVTKEKPEVCVEDMATAKHYADTGFFKILAEAGTDTAALSAALESEFPEDLFTPPEDEEPEPVVGTGTDATEDNALMKELNSKTVAELKEYASARGIDTAGLSKKADLVQHISSEQKKADEARALLRGE